MTLLARIEARRKAEGCSKDDDPTQHDKPKAFVPEWRKHLQAKDLTRVAA